MKDKRYSRYKRDDILAQLVLYQNKLKVQVVQRSMVGYSLSLLRLDKGERLRCIILGRSSDWWKFSLGCYEWDHGIEAIICATHDSCVPVPVLAMDVFDWWTELTIDGKFGPLEPKFDTNKKAIPDNFDRARRTEFGHNILIGGLMCRRDDALARLATFKPSTQRRIRAELVKLRRRRPGRPLGVSPDPQSTELKIVS